MTDSKIDQRRRAFLERALSTGMLVGGLGWNAPLAASWLGRVPGKLPEGRSIFELRGDVRVNGTPATLDTRIEASDRITTGEGAYVITAVGQTAFLLRERSSLELDGRAVFVRSMRLLTGAVLGVFGRRRAEDELQLSTPIATIGIRGTGVYSESAPDRSYLCTCYGTVDIASALDPAEKVRVVSQHHDAAKYVLREPDAGQRIVPAPFINHTDLELATLEALVGRTVPFGLQDDDYEGPRRTY